jgi:hypothetical protein
MVREHHAAYSVPALPITKLDHLAPLAAWTKETFAEYRASLAG